MSFSNLFYRRRFVSARLFRSGAFPPTELAPVGEAAALAPSCQSAARGKRVQTRRQSLPSQTEPFNSAFQDEPEETRKKGLERERRLRWESPLVEAEETSERRYRRSNHRRLPAATLVPRFRCKSDFYASEASRSAEKANVQFWLDLNVTTTS